MKLPTSIFSAAALSCLLLAARVEAQTVQGPTVQTSDYHYPPGSNPILGSITLADGTNSIIDVTTVATVADQGWGGSGLGNGVYLQLDDSSNNVVFSEAVAIATHSGDTYSQQWQTISLDLAAQDPNALANLNAALASTSMDGDTINLVAGPVTWDGWQLYVNNSSETVTSAITTPDGGTTIAMLGAALTAAGFIRRKARR